LLIDGITSWGLACKTIITVNVIILSIGDSTYGWDDIAGSPAE